MPKKYNELPLSGTIVIDVPKKILRFDKKDNLVLADTLTKTNQVKGGKSKSIKLIPVAGNQTRIVNPGILKPADKKSRMTLAEKVNDEMAKIEMKVEKAKQKAPSSTSVKVSKKKKSQY